MDPFEKLKSFIVPKGKIRKKRATSIIVYERDSSGNRIYRRRKMVTNFKNKKKKQVSDDELEGNDDILVNEISNEAEETTYVEKSIHDSLLLLKSFVEPSVKRKQKPWVERMEDSEKSWQEHREDIIKVVIQMHHLESICSLCTNKGIIVCRECSYSCMCYECDYKVHIDDPYHNRISHVDGYPIPLSPLETYNENLKLQYTNRLMPLKIKCCMYCNSQNLVRKPLDDVVVIVTMSGRYELYKYFSYCETCNKSFDPFNLETIIFSGYWPGTFTKFNYLIHNVVFETWDLFRKRMPGTSQKSFLDALNDVTLKNGRIGTIYSHPFSLAFKEWCYCQYEIGMLSSADWMKCPSCSISQHSSHVDGNCKLYRYHSSGRRRRQSYYENVFIQNDADVDRYMKTIYSAGWKTRQQPDVQCGGIWTAAKNISRKNATLDETGLEVATCRHIVAQKALNMKRGEVYGYPLYLIKFHMVENNVQFVFADVMCKLWKFIERVEKPVINKIKPALSVMHAKGHSLFCQVKWDGLWTQGTGRSTGEETEQFFSFISRCSNTTKYQLPEGREESITELTMDWNRKKILQLPFYLQKRMQRIKSDICDLERNLKDGFKKLNQEYSVNVIESYLSEIKLSVPEGKRSSKVTLSDQQQLIVLYNYIQRAGIVTSHTSKIQSLKDFILPDLSHRFIASPINQSEQKQKFENLLQKLDISDLSNVYHNLIQGHIKPCLQEDIEKCYFEKTHWSAMLKKVGDHSKRRHVIRKKMSVAKDKITRHVNNIKYLEEYRDLTVEKCLSGNFPWKDSLSSTQLGITAGDKRYLVDMYLKLRRSIEEETLLLKDMCSFVEYYRAVIENVRSEIETVKQQKDMEISVASNDNLSQRYHTNCNNIAIVNGKLALLKSALAFGESQLAKGIKMFGPVLSPTLELPSALQAIECEQSEPDVIVFPNTGEFSSEDLDEFDDELICVTGMELSKTLKVETCDVSYDHDVRTIMLPCEFSQGALSGRNGSNACTLICLLFGYVFLKRLRDDPLRNRMQTLLVSFVGSMEMGNVLYDDYKCSGLLSVFEAVNIVPAKLGLNIGFEINIMESELFEELSNYSTSKDDTFMILVRQDKAVTFLFCDACLMIADSHRHVPFGARISFTKDNLKLLLKNVFGEDYEPNSFFYMAEIIVQ